MSMQEREVPAEDGNGGNAWRCILMREREKILAEDGNGGNVWSLDGA